MYWDPFEELDRMHEEMDRLFRRSFFSQSAPLLENKTNKGELSALGYARMPVCHMHETENKIIASLELPGVEKSDIELNLDDKALEIKVVSKKENKQEEKDRKAYSYSMQSQSFYRKLFLQKEVDSSKAEAEYKDGILRVEMPKKEIGENRGKRLQIK